MEPLSRTDQVKVLRGFLAGEINTASLRELLAGHMSIKGDWATFSIDITKPLEVKVTVSPEDLRPMLESYLAWKVDDDELARLFEPAAADGLVDADRAVPPPLEPITRLGDVWQLGAHRLICGDSTKRETLDGLFGADSRAGLVLTDPP